MASIILELPRNIKLTFSIVQPKHFLSVWPLRCEGIRGSLSRCFVRWYQQQKVHRERYVGMPCGYAVIRSYHILMIDVHSDHTTDVLLITKELKSNTNSLTLSVVEMSWCQCCLKYARWKLQFVKPWSSTIYSVCSCFIYISWFFSFFSFFWGRGGRGEDLHTALFRLFILLSVFKIPWLSWFLGQFQGGQEFLSYFLSLYHLYILWPPNIYYVCSILLSWFHVIPGKFQCYSLNYFATSSKFDWFHCSITCSPCRCGWIS